jgi:SAM-dependent methyltransferase
MAVEYKEFGYPDAQPFHTAAYLMPQIEKLWPQSDRPLRLLDVGCGNGYIAGHYLARGHQVVGIDLSPEGIELARRTYPAGRFELMEADENILQKLGEEPFDVVISTEVVEHLYSPRPYARGCYSALKPGGRFILSTPYHGYLKNLAVAVLGRFDRHVSALWDGGHIKFWSYNTLSALLKEMGFVNILFRGAGRFPYLWKSMVMSGDKPA